MITAAATFRRPLRPQFDGAGLVPRGRPRFDGARLVPRGRLGFGTVDSRTSMPRVGMVGGGQLARMTHQAGIALGQTLRVLSVSADDCAALVTPDVVIGEHTDLDALRRFAAGCDVIT